MNLNRIGMAIVVCMISGMAFAQDHSTTYETNQGQVTVNSGQPPARDPGPAPAWGQLDTNGNGSIDQSEAQGYALLANDFKYADSNRNGSVSKSEYTRWVNAQ